jgi:hypothetical protein
MLAGHIFYYFRYILCDEYVGGPNFGKYLSKISKLFSYNRRVPLPQAPPNVNLPP